jgi:hypothetical protein
LHLSSLPNSSCSNSARKLTSLLLKRTHEQKEELHPWHE